MNNSGNNNLLDAVIIGAGQSGLSCSYFLKQNQLNHLVLEAGQIGNCWLSQRWDSFVLNSPNHLNLLPGETQAVQNPGTFQTGVHFAEKLKSYALRFELPVQESTKVINLDIAEDGVTFHISAVHHGKPENWFTKNVIIASGAQVKPKIPAIGKQLSATIHQLHSSEYRNPQNLPEGSVLIVGSATSGAQIAEDLLEANRKVFLATSAVARVPRRYRGRDVMDWLAIMGFFDKPTSIAEPHEINMTAPLMSGVGEFGHTISLQSLKKQGAILLGRLESIGQNNLTFTNNLSDNIKFGDSFSNQVKQGIDKFIEATGIQTVPKEIDEADLSEDSDLNGSLHKDIYWKEENITTIIWSTGFNANWDWIKLPVFDDDGAMIHKQGITDFPGLYVVGLPWQRNLKSSLIYGAGEDAEYVTSKILETMAPIPVLS